MRPAHVKHHYVVPIISSYDLNSRLMYLKHDSKAREDAGYLYSTVHNTFVR